VADPAQLVQHHYLRPNRGASPDSDSSSTYYFPWLHPTLSNNLLVVRLTFPYSAGRTISVTDNIGNTYAQDKKQDDTSNLFSVAFYSCPNATAGSTLVTVTFDTTIYGVGCSLTELSGMATSSHVDTSVGTSTATDPNVATGSMTPGTSNTLVMQTGVMTNANTSYGINKCGNITSSGSFTMLGCSRETLMVDQCKLHASGSINPTFSCTITVASPGQPWLTAAVAYKTNGAAGTPRPTGAVRLIRGIHGAMNDGAAAVTNPTFEFPCGGDFAAVMTCFGDGQASFNSASDTDGGTWRVPSHGSGMPQIAYSHNRTANSARRVTMTLSTAYLMNYCLVDVSGIRTNANPIVGVATESSDTQVFSRQDITPAPSMSPSNVGNLLLASMNEGHGPVSALTSPSGAQILNSHYINHTDTSATDDSGDGYGWALSTSTQSHVFTWTSAVPQWPTTITRSGTTATASIGTVAILFYNDGDQVEIAGATQPEYNGIFTISNVVVGTGKFDYTVSGAPATPATGTITSCQLTAWVGVVWEFEKYPGPALDNYRRHPKFLLRTPKPPHNDSRT